MKRLLLIRHAKSDWNADYQTDHDRPLNKRGQKSARLMGAFIDRTVGPPDGILTSSAVRARTTVEIAAQDRGWSCPVAVSEGLYGASVSEAVREIRQADEQWSTMLVAGHEPTWSALVGELIGGASVRMPTAAVACVDLDSESWKEIRLGSGLLVWHVVPKLLQAARLESDD